MQWIDVNAEAHQRNLDRGERGGEPHLGVCLRSPCHRFRVAVDDLRAEDIDRTWSVWDMTGVAPMVLAGALKSSAAAMRVGEAAVESRALRVALRLAAIGRAVLAGARRLAA